MSIASEISRISGNVSDALDAIEAKGVTIPSGANSDDLATLIGQISGGGTGAVSVVDTQDSHGGIVRTITAVDISDTTAVAADVASGKYFYTAAGQKTAGTGSGGSPNLQAKTGITPTTNSQTITPDSGYDGLSSVQINAMPSGTAGTPTASKGSVSNHSISVTPSVTNTAGYISGGTKTGTAVTVSASELVSGSQTITDNGTVDVTNLASVTVSVSGGGGGGDIKDPIRFFDYDGTLVASYSTAPSALPSVPTHTGLTGGTWNYTLQEISTQFNAVGSCDIGANYVTSSGDTEIDIILYDGRLSPRLALSPNGTVEIDWGDGSAVTTVTGTALNQRKDTLHEYSAAGAYTIKVHVTSGSFAFFGTATYHLMHAGSSTANVNKVYANAVKAIRIGNNAAISTYAFYQCSSLKSISIPSTITALSSDIFGNCFSLEFVAIPRGITSVGSEVFYYCYALKAVSLPISVTSMGTYVFTSCAAMNRISIPSGMTDLGTYFFNACATLSSIVFPGGITTIGSYSFSGCYVISKLTIPASVTSIEGSAFNNCYGVSEYHVKPTAPPTLGSNAFKNIQSGCIIYVPSASLSDYQTAWSTYASYLQGE